MKLAKVRIISIVYSTAYDDDMIGLHAWQEFDSKQKAIDFINERRHPHGLTPEQNEELRDLSCTTVGREHYFILYPDEQIQWIKGLVREIL